MDSLDVNGEDDGSRVLGALNISVETPLDPQSNTTITFAVLLCHTYDLQPDFDTYLAALDVYAWVLWSCGLVVLMATCALYVLSLRSALRHWKQSAVSVAIVLGVYPLVAATGFVAIVVPRARLLAEAVSQEVVMIAIYHFFTMIITDCGGPDHLVKQAAGARLETRVLPCCCWPCCFIPRPKLQKKHLTWLRCLVLQMPVIQGLIYYIIIILRAENMGLYLQWYSYFLPFIAVSITFGMWGIMMSVRMAQTAGVNVRPRLLVLQLMLPIVKLQCGLAKSLPESVDFFCIVALNPSVFANMIQNSLMILEMLLLSLWAWRLYRVPPSKRVEMALEAIHVPDALDDTEALDVRRP